MSWLNFNDSLNNLKGQITNFATNVLADNEEGTFFICYHVCYFTFVLHNVCFLSVGNNIHDKDVEELRKICVRQELEVGFQLYSDLGILY